MLASMSRAHALLVLVAGLVACVPVDAQEDPSAGSAARPARETPTWGGLSVIERGDPRANGALVLLHGWGAPGDDLVSLGEELARAAPMRVVLPAAPLEMPHGGRAWYDRGATDSDPQIGRARAAIEGVIATLGQRGVAPERVVVAGFSQGGILSIEVGLAGRTRLAGIAVLSGRALSHPARVYSHLRGLPVFWSHGRSDDRIPFARGEAFRDRASAAGALIEPVPFEGGHAIPPVVVEALGRWLRVRLGA